MSYKKYNFKIEGSIEATGYTIKDLKEEIKLALNSHGFGVMKLNVSTVPNKQSKDEQK